MKFICVLVFCCLATIVGRGQINHFIYIQTENKQPFYIKLKERLYSSSAQGYLVVPKLTEGDYKITIGFPKNEFPPKKLNITVGKNDEGYLYKQTLNKEWALYNLYTMQLVNDVAITQAEVKSEEKDTIARNPATSNEKLIPENSPITIKKLEEAKTIVEPVPTVVDSLVLVNEAATKEPVIKPLPQLVSKISHTADAGSAFVSYAVKEEAGMDTVDIIIESVAINQQPTTSNQQPAPTIQQPATSIQQPTTSNQQPATTTQQPATSIPQPVTSNQPPAAIISTNMNCKKMASEQDFFQLRKKMAAASSEDEMIILATKAFRLRCYSTVQVRNLAVLLLQDEGRYRFLDVSYAGVSDQHNFRTLRNLLTDDYYLKRFDAMLR